MPLKTDYLNDVFSGNRKYNMITNSDGTVSLEDVTVYSVEGDDFGANDINDTNSEINNFAMGALTGIDLSSEDYTLDESDYDKGTLIIDTASEDYTLILPTGYYYKYVIVNLDTATPLRAGHSTSVYQTIPPLSSCVLLYYGSNYILLGANPTYQKHIITATNGNTYDDYPLGISYSNVEGTTYAQSDQDDNTDFPEKAGTLLTVNSNNIRCSQTFRKYIGYGLYERMYNVNSNGWEPWRRIDSENRLTGVTTTTLTLSDMNSVIRVSSTDAIYVHIPSDANEDLPLDFEVAIVQEGTYQIEITYDSGVTLNSEGGYIYSDGQYTSFVLRKVDADTWVAVGRLTDTIV